jgi:alpha-D-xyloside xylohydrolase
MNLRKGWGKTFIMGALLGGCCFQGALLAVAIPVTSVTKDATGVTFGMTPGAMRIDICTDGIVRVRYSQQSTMPVDNNMSFLVSKTWPTVSFTQTETASDVSIVTSKIQVKVNKTTGAVTFLDANGTTVLQEAAGGGKSLTAATINGESTFTCEQIFDSPADEGIYGLGSMHDNYINYRGIPQYLYQANTHIAIPMIISSKGYGILWANASRTYFNKPDQRITLSGGNGQFTTTEAGDYVFLGVDGPYQANINLTVDGTFVNGLSNTWHSGSIAGRINLPANKNVTVSLTGSGISLYGGPYQSATKFTSRSGQTVDYYFFYGPSPDEVIAGYRLATGAASLFSKGTYGFIQCRERYASQTEILDNASQFRSKKIPVDVIVQDWNYWAGGWNSMVFTSDYPNPTQMISTLHNQNFAYMISVWSKTDGGSAVDNALSSYKYSGTSFYDAFNPSARTVYWSNMNTRLFSLGVDAFWQDANEPEGVNLENCKVNFGSGQVGGKNYANAYGMFVCKNVYDGWRSANSTKRVCIKSRSAFAGTQRLGTFCWNGDIGGNWDWYQRSVRAGLNFCMAGMPYWTTDIGGFFRPSNQYSDAGYQELLTRWIEYGAFCPMFRIHGYQSQTEIWRYTTAVQNAFMTYDNLRYRLLPYIYSLAGMVNLNGYTMMRGLVMDFRTDDKVLNISDQFMFGPAFLVNPIMSAGATSRSVYLPAGTWYNFWNGQTSTGGQSVTARAPKDTIPLFVRAGSIVPMGPYLQYANEKKADTIELRVYPGANGSFGLYEDEGDNYNYENGKYSIIPITYTDNPKNVIIGARSGSFTGMDAKKIFTIIYVSNNHGTGVGITTQSDCTLEYSGAQVSCIPVGVRPAGLANATIVPTSALFRTAGNMIMLPHAFSGKTKAIALYDCSGRLLKKTVVKKNVVDVQKDLGLPAGVYVIKARVIK